MGKYLVTGSAGGIGGAIQHRIESEGHDVIGLDLQGADIDADLSTPEGRRAASDAAVAMELAYQLTRRNSDLNLVWRRRDTNVEADALTNEDFTSFDPAKRVDAARHSTRFDC